MTTAVGSFYRFEPIADPAALARDVHAGCSAGKLRGTVLLAPEGVNATLAGDRNEIEGVVSRWFPNVNVKWSLAVAGNPVFDRMNVRVKPEIVTFGLALVPGTPVGRHVSGADWERMLEDPAVTVIDVRNDYETAIGTFDGAIPANTATFGDFRAFVGARLDPTQHTRIAMFCTGGIRCEKASAYLIERGFEDVCQLDGGILSYLTETRATRFNGECFVFDQRVSVSGELCQGDLRLYER